MKLFSRNDGGEDFKLGEHNLRYELFSFKILIENEVSYLKVLGRSKDLDRYQIILDYLKSNFMIVGEIDCHVDIGITFKNPNMSVMMAIAMIKNNWAISEKEYDFLDLVKLLKKSYHSVSKGAYKNLQDDIMLTLISKYNELEEKNRELNKISSSLELHTPPLILSLKNRCKMYFDHIDVILKDITNMLCYSTKLIRNIICEMMLLKDKCNEVAYLASVSVETLKNIYQMRPLEFLSLARQCFKGCDNFLEDVQLDIDNIISVYLRKFKLSHDLLDLIDDKKSNKNNVGIMQVSV